MKKMIFLAFISSVFMLSGCENRQAMGAVGGAAVGATVGGLAGGTTGAAIGGVAGAGLGSYIARDKK